MANDAGLFPTPATARDGTSDPLLCLDENKSGIEVRCLLGEAAEVLLPSEVFRLADDFDDVPRSAAFALRALVI